MKLVNQKSREWEQYYTKIEDDIKHRDVRLAESKKWGKQALLNAKFLKKTLDAIDEKYEKALKQSDEKDEQALTSAKDKMNSKHNNAMEWMEQKHKDALVMRDDSIK